ncbi:hypothetical protein SAMN04489722_1021, partial [Algibacter lectus]
TLTQFLGMGKVNTLGIKQANKCMHVSATAYNLKKYLKYMKNLSESIAGILVIIKSTKKHLISVRMICFKPLIF